MKPAAFEYVRPKTVPEAIELLARAGTSVAVIAGGQSLIPLLNLRIAQPDLLVDVGGLEELKETGETADGLRIGALTTHSDIEASATTARSAAVSRLPILPPIGRSV
jgi:carbon-monoxide dehydrogenase medium subunit